MKQLLQYFRTGEIELIEAPIPRADANSLIVQSRKSLISVGTEKMMIDFGKASVINKIKQQPDKVKQVLDKIKTEGLLSTAEAVWSKLNDPIPLGYSNVGTILEKGAHVNQFEIGQRVVSNGSHAEFVKVPWTLTAAVPENVTDEAASFTVLGSISMEGIRLVNPTLGETIAVIGLGLLGQLTCQILQASGCRVIGVDIDKSKVELARSQGIEAFVSGSLDENVRYVLGTTNETGVDGVIITASTSSEEVLSQCAAMCRKRGRIVLIGVIPITVPRSLFYEKELSFQVSAAYGPGRYDPVYEEKGIDYPLPYVRWTAKRNMEAFLFLLKGKKVNVAELITHRYPFLDAVAAYETIEKGKPLGIILEYPADQPAQIIKEAVQAKEVTVKKGKPCIGFIGAGNFAKMTLLPALHKMGADIRMIADLQGYPGTIAARRFGIQKAVADKEELYANGDINTIFIATRHSSHAFLVKEALQRGRHVFVEKPLAMNLKELCEINELARQLSGQSLMVGFNRRFSPFTQKLITVLAKRSDPISTIITVNAGAIPANHWVHDPAVGGGRIVGEACHFIDLARYITGSPILSVGALSTKGHSGTDSDKVMINLTFEDGSQASVNYLANGSKKFPKERVEVFSSERVYVIENFKSLISYGASLSAKSMKQDKGHREEVRRYLDHIERGLDCPISLDELMEIHLATFAVEKSIQDRKFIMISDMRSEMEKLGQKD